MQPNIFTTTYTDPALFLGPEIHAGKMSTIFYFCTSASETLLEHPFNSPIEILLRENNVRVFSFDVPGHGAGLDSKEAISFWGESIKENQDILSPFFDSTAKAIEEIVQEVNTPNQPIGLMGLSRGAYVAAQIASRLTMPSCIVGFAPLTDLHILEEFIEIDHNHPLIERLQLKKIIPKIIQRPLHFFIGNHDTRVGTSHCYSFIHELVNHSVKHGIRSPDVTLSIVPSIGHHGHGTSPESFLAGSDWMMKKLLHSHTKKE